MSNTNWIDTHMNWIDSLAEHRGVEVIACIEGQWQLAKFAARSRFSDLIYVYVEFSNGTHANYTLDRWKIKPVTPDNLLLIFGE